VKEETVEVVKANKERGKLGGDKAMKVVYDDRLTLRVLGMSSPLRTALAAGTFIHPETRR
jgi:hypothetical protein